MALGTISSLGVGSNFELQQMLDSLRAVDEVPIDRKIASQTRLEEQLAEYNTLSSKITTMKSSALYLSLESSFLEKSVSLSDEDVLDVTATEGADATSYSFELTQLATRNSWESAGAESADSFIYTPPVTGFTSQDAVALTEAKTLTFTVGAGEEQKSIDLNLASGSTLNQIVNAINDDPDNQDGTGSTYVTASIASNDNNFYIRLASTDTSFANNNQILVTSSGFDFIAPDITFAYQVGDEGAVTYVQVPPATTFSGLTSLINDDSSNSVIEAAVIDDGIGDNSYYFTLTAVESGEDNRITLNGITMTEVQGAEGASLNAKFSVNGIAYERQTNDSLTDVISGLSITLKEEGTSNISVTSDTDSVKEKVTGLITEYNDIIQEIVSKSNYATDTEQSGILSDVSAMKTLAADLTNLMDTTISTGTDITSLYNLGMETDRDGIISIDEDILDEAFTSDFASIKKLFLGISDDNIEGLGDILNDALRTITGSYGTLGIEINYAEDKIDRLGDDIETAQARLDVKYEIMAMQFIQLDSYVGKMSAQASFLTNMFDAYSKTMK